MPDVWSFVTPYVMPAAFALEEPLLVLIFSVAEIARLPAGMGDRSTVTVFVAVLAVLGRS